MIKSVTYQKNWNNKYIPTKTIQMIEILKSLLVEGTFSYNTNLLSKYTLIEVVLSCIVCGNEYLYKNTRIQWLRESLSSQLG